MDRRSRLAALAWWLALLSIAILSGQWLAAGTKRAVAQGPEEWSTPVTLSESTTASYYPDIAVDSAGHVYVVWGEFSPEHEGEGYPDQLMFRLSDGENWSDATDIKVEGHLPQIEVDSRGALHVVRVARTRGGQSVLLYSRAWAQRNPADAKNWTPDRMLSDGYAYWPDLLVDGLDRVHVVYSGEGGVKYVCSRDGGESWSDPVQIDHPLDATETPRLAADRAGNLFVVWQIHDPDQRRPDGSDKTVAIGFSSSSNGGATWTSPVEIPVGDQGAEWPQAAVDSTGTIHIVWRSQVGGTIGYTSSSDRGTDWSAIEQIDHFAMGPYSHDLEVDSADNLHMAVPLRSIGSVPSTSHLVRTPDGRWSAPTDLSQNQCSAGSADIELVIGQGNHLHAVWYDRQECVLGWVAPSGRGEVFYSSLVLDSPGLLPQPLPPMPTPTRTVAIEPQIVSFATPRAIGSPTAALIGGIKSPQSSALNELVVGLGATVLVMAMAATMVVWRRR